MPGPFFCFPKAFRPFPIRPWRCSIRGALVLGLAELILIAPPLASTQARQLLDVRFGRHQDQIRAVLDLDSAGPFTQALSADGRTVTIGLADTGLASNSSHRALVNLAPLVAVDMASGIPPTTAEIHFQANSPVRVAIQALPAETHAHHRIAIDFVAAVSPPTPSASASASASTSALTPASTSLLAPALALLPPLTPVSPPSPAPAPVSAPPLALPPALASPVAAPSPASAGTHPEHPLEVPEEARPPTFAPLPPHPNRPAPNAAESAQIQHWLTQARHAQDSADDVGAFGLYRQAADAGSPEAAFAVGQMYRLGAGVPANPALAAFWYGEAARAGYPPAEMNFGVMQLRGIGLEANPAAGLEMVKRAAAHGNASAIDLLSEIAHADKSHPAPGLPPEAHAQ